MTVRKNIVITGASSGLGEQMARDFAAMGRNLGLCARRTERLDTLRAELLDRNPGITVSVRALDVNEHQQVFDVFKAFRADLGTVDRVIVNAGLGKGQPIGTGRFDANLATAQTNFVAGLAQCEAAMEIFRDQNAGHLVVISSISALRGMPRNMSTYSATKAGLARLAEGIRSDMIGKPIKVTTVYAGYIASEMNEKVAAQMPLLVSTKKGVASMVHWIEREPAQAMTPAWPWLPLSYAVKYAPLGLVKRFV